MSLNRKSVGGKSGQHHSSSNRLRDKIAVTSGDEETESEWFERADHPLLNDLLLPMILGYARGNDLKSFRSVCRRWNNLSIPFTRTRLEVSLWSKRSEKSGMHGFMELMRSNTLGIPFARFYLGSFDYTKGFGQQFVKLFGITTKELTLSNHEASTVESISELLRSMPKLESFTIPSHRTSRDGSIVKLFPGTKPKLSFLKSLSLADGFSKGEIGFCPTFYEELFEAAPNISSFDLVCGDNHDVCFEVLESLEKLGRGSSIKCLRLTKINDEILELLRKMVTRGMNLKDLHLSVREYVQNNPQWSELVTLFKDSLISLTINSLWTVSFIRFPTMPKLIKLKLMMSGTTSLSCEDFTKTFPALEELHFVDGRQSNQFDYFVTGDQSSTMRRLIIGGSLELNMEMLNLILLAFPALTRLECPVLEEDGVEVIRNIWIHMTQLQGLHIRGILPAGVNVDSMVIGIPVQAIEKMRVSDVFGSLGKRTRFQREKMLELIMMNKDFKGPSIRNLTNLRSLSLNLKADGSEDQRPNYSTDLTAYFGLYSIKTLRHLYVSDCEFSKPCCEVLVKDMDLMTWSFGDIFGDNISEIIPPRLNHNDEHVYQ